MCDEQLPAVVFDNGTGTIKAGCAGDARPRAEFLSVVGRPCQESQNRAEWVRSKDTFIGEEALSITDQILVINHPIERAVVTNWDSLMKIWEHTFYEELRVRPEDHPILVTEPPRNPKRNREKMAEIIFQTYSSPSLYIAIQAVLSLYASGLTTGLVLDCGDGASDVVPIFSGHAIHHAIFRLDVAGGDVTDYLMKILNEQGFGQFRTASDREIVREIKENLAYVPIHFKDEMIRARFRPEVVEQKYKLPDGQEILMGTQRFRCTEPLFLPSVLGVGSPGLPEAAYKAVTKCDLDTRKELFSNVVVCGGTTNLRGFSDRVYHELRNLAPEERIRVLSPIKRKYMVWLGGSILASLSSFNGMWISKSQYEEEGPCVIYKKCF